MGFGVKDGADMKEEVGGGGGKVDKLPPLLVYKHTIDCQPFIEVFTVGELNSLGHITRTQGLEVCLHFGELFILILGLGWTEGLMIVSVVVAEDVGGFGGMSGGGLG